MMIFVASLLYIVISARANSLESCALKFQDSDVCACSTYDSDGPVRCQNGSNLVEIQPCYCAYFDQQLQKLLVGHCYYTCYQYNSTIVAVSNTTNFNNAFCYQDDYEDDYRSGFFCYECNVSYGIATHSELLIDCRCTHYSYKYWFKYFAISLIPLTILYIFAVLLKCNITSSSFGGILLVLQCITSSGLRTYYFEGPTNNFNAFKHLVLGMIEMASLKFFESYHWTDSCLHPELNVFQKLSLGYIAALYPFLLIFITYMLVVAYDRECRVLVWLWKPFRKCALCYRKTWNIHTSLVETFATFVLLSSVLVMQTSLGLLSWITTYDLAGNRVGTVASMSANVEYFGHQHLPYALLAIATGSVFVLLILLLTLYPCRWFQRCLNACGLRLLSLHMLMDAFQGSYKLEPRDLRYFSAFYLLLRLLMLAHVELFLSPQSFYISGILSLAAAAIIAICQPYKVNTHNTVDSVLLVLMGVYFISCSEAYLLGVSRFFQDLSFPHVIQGLCLSLIVLYFICFVTWRLMGKKTWAVMQTIGRKIKAAFCNEDEISSVNDARSFSSDEIQDYPPLLQETWQSTY